MLKSCSILLSTAPSKEACIAIQPKAPNVAVSFDLVTKNCMSYTCVNPKNQSALFESVSNASRETVNRISKENIEKIVADTRVMQTEMTASLNKNNAYPVLSVGRKVDNNQSDIMIKEREELDKKEAERVLSLTRTAKWEAASADTRKMWEDANEDTKNRWCDASNPWKKEMTVGECIQHIDLNYPGWKGAHRDSGSHNCVAYNVNADKCLGIPPLVSQGYSIISDDTYKAERRKGESEKEERVMRDAALSKEWEGF